MARLVVVERGGSAGYKVAGGRRSSRRSSRSRSRWRSRSRSRKSSRSSRRRKMGSGAGQRGGVVCLRLALALWRGQLYRLADACAR